MKFSTIPDLKDWKAIFIQLKKFHFIQHFWAVKLLLKHLTGKVKLNVKPETQNDTKVKLKGKGLPKYKKENQHGDLFITYKIVLPKNLSEKEKELFTELSKLR